MDRLEDELRATFADDRLSLSPRPDASALVHAGVRRRRRNRAVASVAAVVVLVGGGAAVGATLAGRGGGTERVVPPTATTPTPTGKPSLPPATQDEVPWAATAYDYRHPPAFPGAVADPAVPWCRASQLALSQFFQGATGSWTGGVTVTNRSTTTCALQGQPTVSMLAVDGHPLVASHAEPFYVDQWVRLSPGRQASAQVTWFPEFCHQQVVTTVAVALPHAGGTLTTGMRGSPRCDSESLPPSAGHLDVDGFLAPPGSVFTPLADLEARLDRVPASTLPGGVVAYRLQLQSSGPPELRLDPCLPYRERLVDHATGRVLFEEDHLLNCAAAPATVASSPSQRWTYFDLRIAVPTDAPAGDYDLLWQSVLKPVYAVADGLVRVQSAPPACRDGQVAASDGSRDQAMNQYGHTIVLTNVSASACSLRGYPGVRLVDGAGRPIGKDAVRGDGYVFPDPGPATVVLAPRTGKASFTFGGPGITGGGQVPCPTSSAALVFPPGMRVQLRVAMVEPYCQGGISTSAVVAGTRGARFG